MRAVLAAAAVLLMAAACGDAAVPSTAAAEPATTTAAPPETTVPATTAAVAPTTTAPPQPELPDMGAVTDCAGLVDAALGLLQAVFDGLGDMTLDDLDAAAETPPALRLLETEGEKIDARTAELGCDPGELEARVFGRVGELEARGDLSRLILAGFAEEAPGPGTDVPDGVEFFEVGDASHTEETVAYDRDPPAGGPHHPAWQNCGFYSEPVVNEHAVHSLEHGAIWITYDAGFATDIELDALRAIATEAKVLVSPHEGLGEFPVVASAWGAQLRLESALDARLLQFVGALRDSTAPEPGAACQGGIGEPE